MGKGKELGGIWGAKDEIGALNAVTTESVLAALKLVKKGKVSDLGRSWPTPTRLSAHSATRITSRQWMRKKTW